MKVDEYDIRNTEELSNGDASEEEAQVNKSKEIALKVDKSKEKRNQLRENESATMIIC